MLIDSLGVGGAETHVEVLATEMSTLGCEVCVASAGGVIAEKLKKRGVAHLLLPSVAPFRVPMTVKCAAKRSVVTAVLEKIMSLFSLPRRIFGTRARISGYIKAERPDVVHVHTRRMAFIAAPICKREHIPLVVTAHAMFSMSGGKGRLSRWGDLTLAVGEDIKNHLLTSGASPSGEIRVIPNGVKLAHMGARCKADAVGGRKIIFMSRLDADSSLGAHLLCAIAEALSTILPDVQIFIVGGGSEFSRLCGSAERINDALATSGNTGIDVQRKNRPLINMVGSVDEPMKWLESHSENALFVGVSRAAIEAMACGIPAILLGNEGYLGLLDEKKLEAARVSNFTARGYKTLTEETKHLLFDEICKFFLLENEEKSHLSRLSEEEVRKNYSAEIMARQVLDAYKYALASANHPRKTSGARAPARPDANENDKTRNSPTCAPPTISESADEYHSASEISTLLASASARKNVGLTKKARARMLAVGRRSVTARPSPKKVVICGYYGRGNLGDEAILEALLKILGEISFAHDSSGAKGNQPNEISRASFVPSNHTNTGSAKALVDLSCSETSFAGENMRDNYSNTASGKLINGVSPPETSVLMPKKSEISSEASTHPPKESEIHPETSAAPWIAGEINYGNTPDAAEESCSCLQISDSKVVSGEKALEIRILRDKNIIKIIKNMWRADLFVFGGGSLLQNATSSASLFYYLALIRVARALCKRTIMLANGFGPITKGVLERKIALFCVKNSVKTFDHISTRDSISQNELKKLLPNRNIDLILDPALLFFEKSDEKINQKLINMEIEEQKRESKGGVAGGANKNEQCASSGSADEILVESTRKATAEGARSSGATDEYFIFCPNGRFFGAGLQDELISKVKCQKLAPMCAVAKNSDDSDFTAEMSHAAKVDSIGFAVERLVCGNMGRGDSTVKKPATKKVLVGDFAAEGTVAAKVGRGDFTVKKIATKGADVGNLAVGVAESLRAVRDYYSLPCALLVLNPREDGMVAHKIAGALGGAKILTPRNPREAISIVEGAKFVISQRYHALLFAVGCEKIALAASSDPKVKALCCDFGIYHSVENGVLLNDRALLCEIKRAAKHFCERSEKIARSVEEKATKMHIDVKNLLEKMIFPIDKDEQMFYNIEKDIKGKEK